MKLARPLVLVLVAGLTGAGCQTADTASGRAGETRDEMVRFLTEMPKAELHLHLEGSLPPQTVVDLAVRNGIDSFQSVADVELSLAGREPGLLGFLSHYNEALKVLRTEQDFYQATFDLLNAERENGVVYVELTFDPQAHTARGIPFDAVIRGIDQGRVAAAEALGIEAHLIMAINRERSVESAFEMLEQAAPYRDRILGLGLDSGPEEGNPPSKFQAVYARAREQGYRLTIHCDVDQPSSIEHIWQSLDLLRVERIDHGLDSIGDPELVAELLRRGICLTACPVQRSTDPEPQDLDKIRGLFEAGACVNLNTDDPAQFESGYLVDLLYRVQQAGVYSKRDMVRFMVHAFEASFLERSGKDAYLESLRAFAAAHGAAVAASKLHQLQGNQALRSPDSKPSEKISGLLRTRSPKITWPSRIVATTCASPICGRGRSKRFRSTITRSASLPTSIEPTRSS